MFTYSCTSRRHVLSLLAAAAFTLPVLAADGERAELIAVGDSLSAGVMDIGLEFSRQENGYVAVIARQWEKAGLLPKGFVQPLVDFPGAPPVLAIYQNGPIPVIGPAVPLDPFPAYRRLNPTVRPHNVAVPSFTVSDALRYRPNASLPFNPGDRGPLVLGMPGPFTSPGPGACQSMPNDPACIGKTMIEQAKEWRPKTTLVWIGNNDALIPALFADPSRLTPEDKFEADFKKVMSELAGTGTRLVVATIPDVTSIPYFSSIRDIASQYSMPLGQVMKKLDVGPNDYVRRSALPIIDSMLRSQSAGPLPVMCDAPIYVLALVKPRIECRMTASEAREIEASTKAFNKIIEKETKAHGGLLVDTNEFIDQISRKGYVVGREKLTTRFLGGLFSLDGIHPSNTGYAIIANYLIEKMNREFGLNVQPVSVRSVWEADPLRMYASTEPAYK